MNAPISAFSESLLPDLLELKDFLFRRMYRHAKVTEVMASAQNLLSRLFAAYLDEPRRLPENWGASLADRDESKLPRAVCDYIAGMTDAYALAEYKRIFDVEFHL